MVRKNPRVPWVVVLVCALSAVAALAQTPLGTAFTYQGRLTDAGAPANGSYDLQFTPYDAVTAGSPVGSQVTVTSVSVSNGLFTVGQYTSIAIGTDGLPVISYYDQTAGTLKVAKCGTRSCQ